MDNLKYNYLELNQHEILEEKLARTTSVKYDTNQTLIYAAYITTPELLNIFCQYQSLARGASYIGCQVYYIPEEINKKDFRGPDWYFIEGFPADRDGPGAWRLETLSEKKAKFEEWCKEYEAPKKKGV